MKVAEQPAVHGVYNVKIVRDGKVIEDFDSPNLVVDEGLTKMNTSTFTGGTQSATWYLALYKGSYTPTSAATAATIDTLSTEMDTTELSNTVRPTYTVDAGTTEVISNSASPATFTVHASNTTDTVYGAFMISDNAMEGTAGTLMGASLFSAARAVQANDQILLTYTLTLASA